MTAMPVAIPYPVFYDRDGQPLDNGSVYIGVANLDPVTNPLQVYYDDALTITAAQPLKTSNGYVYRNGTPTSLYVNASYSLRVQDADKTTVYNVAEVEQALPAIQVADSMAELRLISTGELVQMTGYYDPGDGGGGVFVWDAASTEADDGGLYILPTGHTGAGRWKRIVESDLVNVRAWGAKNQAGFDNRPAFQAAIDALTVDSYSYNNAGAGYGALNPSGLYVPEGRWEFLTAHPTATDRVLWMRKPMRIVGAGQDRMQFVPKFASGVKWWLVAEPAGPGYVGADYAVGGGISGFGFTGGEGAVWQNCIKVTATNPSAWDAFKIERFFLFKVSNGISLEVAGGATTNYGMIVQEGKILSIGQESAANYNTEDGFSYHYYSAPLGVPYGIEVDCTARSNGWNATGTNNGSTTHDGGQMIRVNCTYSDNQHRQIHDVNGSVTWMVGCTVTAPRAGYYSNYAAGVGGGTLSLMYLDSCTSSGTYDLETIVSGSTIYTSNFTTNGTNVSGATVVSYTP